MTILMMLFVFPFPIIAILMSWYGFYKYPKQWRKVLPVFIYSVFVLAYCITPSYENDLTRYFMQIERLYGMSFYDANLLMKDGLFVKNFAFWIISQLEMPHLLAAITTSIVYGINTYITCDYASRYGYEKKIWIVLMLQILILPFFSIVNNLRNITAFALIVLGAYREFCKNKLDVITILLYIVPCFIHKTGIVLVAIRLLVILFKKIMSLALILVVALPTMIEIAYSNIGYITIGGNIGLVLRILVRSARNYLLGGSAYGEKVQNSFVQNAIRYVVMMLLIIIMSLVFNYVKKAIDSKEKEFSIFCFLIAIISLACNVFDTPAYWRFSIGTIISCSPIVFWVLYHKTQLNVIQKLFIYILPIIAIVRFFLDIYYTWARIDFGEFIVTSLFTNGYTIFFDLIKAIMF